MKCLISDKQLLKKYLGIKHSLNEKTRRLWCAVEAIAIGKRGVSRVSAVTQVTPPTIYAGIRELNVKPLYIVSAHKVEMQPALRARVRARFFSK